MTAPSLAALRTEQVVDGAAGRCGFVAQRLSLHVPGFRCVFPPDHEGLHGDGRGAFHAAPLPDRTDEED